MSAQPRSLEVRPYVRGDGPATLAAFLSAVTVTAAHDYSPEQVAAWSAPEERTVVEWNRARIGLGTIVATIDGQVAGFSDVGSDGYIDMMFVATQFGRLGVASALLAQLEHTARASGVRTLSTDASLTARQFFAKHGFVVATEQHPILRGVRMTNYRMMKTLTVPVIEIRRAAIADATRVAHVHVEAWRQAYASQLPADLLANLDEASRAAQWTQTISDGITDVYVAEADGKIVGWATGSGGRDEGAPARRELEGIYLLETAYGSGAGQLLLDAVVADAPAYLWMLDDNPRAEAFYRKNSFVRDGAGRDKLMAGFPVHIVRMARQEHAMKRSE